MKVFFIKLIAPPLFKAANFSRDDRDDNLGNFLNLLDNYSITLIYYVINTINAAQQSLKNRVHVWLFERQCDNRQRFYCHAFRRISILNRCNMRISALSKRIYAGDVGINAIYSMLKIEVFNSRCVKYNTKNVLVAYALVLPYLIRCKTKVQTPGQTSKRNMKKYFIDYFLWQKPWKQIKLPWKVSQKSVVRNGC